MAPRTAVPISGCRGEKGPSQMISASVDRSPLFSATKRPVFLEPISSSPSKNSLILIGKRPAARRIASIAARLTQMPHLSSDRAPRCQPPINLGRLEWFRPPQAPVSRRLHIVMGVDQDCRLVVPRMQPITVDDGIARGGQRPAALQSDALHSRDYPFGAGFQLGVIGRVLTDRGETQQRLESVEDLGSVAPRQGQSPRKAALRPSLVAWPSFLDADAPLVRLRYSEYSIWFSLCALWQKTPDKPSTAIAARPQSSAEPRADGQLARACRR